MSTTSTDVIVVGAGPTGLLLAGDLAAAGVHCTVLERRDGESNLTRAFVVHARTMETLDARGLAERLTATGRTLDVARLFGRLDLDLSRLPSRFPYLVATPQYNTERVLADRAEECGATIVHGAEVTGLRQDADGVDVEVRTGAHNEPGARHVRRARYVVGTDGVHSAVRRAVGLPFPGHTAISSVMLADVRLTSLPERELSVYVNREGMAFIAPFGDGFHRVIAWDARRDVPEDAPVGLDEIRDIVRRVLGTDHGMHDARWTSRFHSDERQVPRYRVGRVFLAGDAAHAHSPAGGQGMNAGLQDAANLGWKLAAAVHGRAPDGLLDTYHAERHPADAAVLRSSSRLLDLTIAPKRWQRAARSLLPPLAARIEPINRRLSLTISGIDIAYPAPAGAHPLTGRRAPDFALTGGGRLYEALRTGRFVLLVPSGHAETAEEWAGRLDLHRPASAGRPQAMLVRPDGYIAWASDETDPAARDRALRAALQQWCPAADEAAVEAA